jgi:hypothetical protein
MRRLARWLSCSMLALPACSGPTQSGTLFRRGEMQDSGVGFAKVEEQLRVAKRPESVAVAVGVTAQGLVGAALPGGTPWRHGARIEALPEVTVTGVVVATGGGRVLALDGANGRPLFDVSSGSYALRGAADDGAFTVVSLAKAGGASRLLGVARGGQVVLDLETDATLGRPARTCPRSRSHRGASSRAASCVSS